MVTCTTADTTVLVRPPEAADNAITRAIRPTAACDILPTVKQIFYDHARYLWSSITICHILQSLKRKINLQLQSRTEMFCSFPYHISRTKISVFNYTGKLYGSLKHNKNHKIFPLNVLLYNMMPIPYTYWYLNCRAVLVPSMLSVEPALNPNLWLW